MLSPSQKWGVADAIGTGARGGLLLLLAAMAFKDCLIRLPSPPETPAADRFDANRAAARLQRVLGDQRPHPIDSAENDAVRERLLAEMRAVGLQPRVDDGFACNPFARARTIACARVRNVVATLPAEGVDDRAAVNRGPLVLLSTHYDSTFAGPGAADAGIGMATLLETAALIRSRPLRRPVGFLINDGEEMGLIGARAFVVRDPLARRVDSLLNFEARGVTGPAVMFETSRPNGAAIAHYARTVDRPLTNSLTTDLYRLIPNDTDVTVYKSRPWTILNFAIIGNETRYHSPGDNLAALDRRSLQHMGDQALALTSDLAGAGPVQASGERIYTDLLGVQLVVLPLTVGLVLLGLLIVVFLVVAWRRRAFGRPLLAMVAAMIGALGTRLDRPGDPRPDPQRRLLARPSDRRRDRGLRRRARRGPRRAGLDRPQRGPDAAARRLLAACSCSAARRSPSSRRAVRSSSCCRLWSWPPASRSSATSAAPSRSPRSSRCCCCS